MGPSNARELKTQRRFEIFDIPWGAKWFLPWFACFFQINLFLFVSYFIGIDRMHSIFSYSSLSMFIIEICITLFFFFIPIFFLVPGWHAESQEHVHTVYRLAVHIGWEYIFGYRYVKNRLF